MAFIASLFVVISMKRELNDGSVKWPASGDVTVKKASNDIENIDRHIAIGCLSSVVTIRIEQKQHNKNVVHL